MTRKTLADLLWPCLLALGVIAPAQAAEPRTAIFGGGCFWCMEQAYDKVEGVVETTSGYTGGHVENPTYEQVSAGVTGHIEVVKVEYDPEIVDYATLLHVFWRNIDPFVENRQFCDVGDTYQSAIFPLDERQRELAEASLEEVAERFDRDIATRIIDFEAFYPAEDYHQNYYVDNAMRYRYYKSACGRSERLEEIWGDEAEAHGAG
ncbi:peptide-methionine (S)-S-oxide reductase MsrA [Halomonas beimenensis]|uniref:Peptide methionine sulfoxide reductase MsrA n=1 Tax=Halomonas beimenensis TaxID=475662 RepID=A0A291P9B8_9GAMM|nr:peptide-methionine (S)-S-oxide reductase MsrA [Halomonas beimenensis]ATJ83457.1 peptide methionine sulfoxide reductase MsrA [Halomonas beimenensis]